MYFQEGNRPGRSQGYSGKMGSSGPCPCRVSFRIQQALEQGARGCVLSTCREWNQGQPGGRLRPEAGGGIHVTSFSLAETRIPSIRLKTTSFPLKLLLNRWGSAVKCYREH